MAVSQSASFRILLVEDEPLVAMAVEDALLSQGMTVIGPAATVAAALGCIASNEFDGALLDVNLRGEKIDAVADALAARGIPFVFTTGDGTYGLPAAHRNRPMLTKPFRDADLADAIARHLRPA